MTAILQRSWMKILHEGNIYDGFPINDWPMDPEGWGHDNPIFEEVIKKIKPSVIIEVGSWKGGSALNMASFLKKHEINGEIICVDTWLGDGTVMPRQWGRPTLYMSFLANVIHNGHTDVIVPLPTDSISAAMLLRKLRMSADAIYIDAGHDYTHCFQDITWYWSLLRPGGIMFGDDYSMAWPEVVRAVHTFAESKEMVVWNNFPGKWFFLKPEGTK